MLDDILNPNRMSQKNNNLKFIKKNYLWIIILIVLISIVIDYFSSDLTPILKTQTVITEEETKTIKYYSYSWYYNFLRIIVNVLYTLAISLFISVFILKKLEEEENEIFQDRILKLQEGINQNVFDEIFKKLINPEIFDLIKTDIINRESIRKNAKWIYDIIEVDNKLKIIQTINYELFNQTRKKINESMVLNFMPNNDHNVKIIGFKCTAGNTIIHNDNNNLDSFSTSQNKEYQFNIEPDSHVNISLIIENIYENVNILDNHISKYPLLGLDIEFNYPSNYELEVTPSFSSPLNIRTDHNNKRIYENVRAILPGQGITYRIKKNIA